MNSLRVFAVSALFIGTMSVFSACGSDDDDGAGGKKGTGGKDSGLGGSGGVGATGGTGGSGGIGLSGGNGGTTGGTGGTTGGTGGVAGSAGATGGAAGGGGTAGGAAGSAGSAGASSGGSAGSGPDAAAFGVCKETCTTSADCGGTNVCQLGECHAANTYPEKCSVDSDCIAESSGWSIPCTAAAGCTGANMACVDVGGGIGKCATIPPHIFCNLPTNTQFPMPKIDGSGNITVCGDGEAFKCHPVNKTCEQPCTDALDCVQQPACVTGFCGCGSNADCASGYCDVATGICGCDASTDCPSSNPTCSGNKCGCTGVGECTKQFTGTTLSCN